MFPFTFGTHQLNKIESTQQRTPIQGQSQYRPFEINSRFITKKKLNVPVDLCFISAPTLMQLNSPPSETETSDCNATVAFIRIARFAGKASVRNVRF